MIYFKSAYRVHILYYAAYPLLEPIPLSALSMAWDCGRSLAGIAGSNPAKGMDVCLLYSVVFCQVEVSTSDPSLVHRSPTEGGVSESDRKVSVSRGPGPLGLLSQ
jgi:hypothetical protein